MVTRADQRYTTGRRQLVDLLADLGRPVTTYELLEAQPKLTQSSVYRNLVMLADLGVVQRVAGVDDRQRYELAEEIIGHHHHLVCINCGGVEDFTVGAGAERSLEALFEQAVDGTGFRPSSHRLDLLGTCGRCA